MGSNQVAQLLPIITRNQAMYLMATNKLYREEKNPRMKETEPE